MCQLHSELTLQSDLLHTSEKEFAELRRQLSTLRAALTEEEVSHSQARMVSHFTPYSASSTTPSHGFFTSSSLLVPAASGFDCLSAALIQKHAIVNNLCLLLPFAGHQKL